MKRTQALENILAISGGFLLCYFGFKNVWFLYVSIAAIVIGLFFKSLAQLISDYWIKLSEFLGSIMSKVILSLVFFLILTPIAFLQKMGNGNSMKIKKQKQGSLYFDRQNHVYTANDMKDPW